MSVVEFDAPEGTAPLRKVRMSETLFRQLGASRVDWGEPDGFYTPTVHARLDAEDDASTQPVETVP